MRRSLAWLVAVPLMLAGSEAAHALAYRLAYPELHVRVHVLLVTGHGYLRWLPLVLGIAGAVVALSLLVDRGRRCARARAARLAGVGVRIAAAPRVRRPGASRAAAAHRCLPVARGGDADVRARTRAPASVRAARVRGRAAAAPHGRARRPRRPRDSRRRGRALVAAAPAAPASEPPLPRLALISSGLAKSRAAAPRVRLSRPPRGRRPCRPKERDDPQESYPSPRARGRGRARRRGDGALRMHESARPSRWRTSCSCTAWRCRPRRRT